MRENLFETPALELGNGAGLHDPHLVTNGGFTLLIVGVEFLRLLNDFLELGVWNPVDVLDHDGLVHAGRFHQSDALFAKAWLLGLGITHIEIWL
jgi:hypothetical protein